MNDAEFRYLFETLLEQGEVEWVEHKHDWWEPSGIGEYISALANSALLRNRPTGYLLWGVEDSTRKPVGTSVQPAKERVGNQPLKIWLAMQLDPRIRFEFHEHLVDGLRIVMLEVQAACDRPVAFKGIEYVRIGESKTELRRHPEIERSIWQLSERTQFEERIALGSLPGTRVLELLDAKKYYELLGEGAPTSDDSVLARLVSEGFVVAHPGSRYDITNLGALLLAHDLSDFGRLGRKALRVILYDGNSRVLTRKERTLSAGYAVGYENAVAYVSDQLPQNEQIRAALRVTVRVYPDIAVRELIANALIHQDFGVGGAGPTVEIFSDRLEVTNPGRPLIDPSRFIDEPPRSRNEALASVMRRVNICEERGSGIDKVVFQVEFHQLPPPLFRATAESTVAVLFGERAFAKMTKDERVRACYQHACLQYVSNAQMTNATLRKRFGVGDRSYSVISRIIKDTIEAGLVKPSGETLSRKYASYVPFWA